MRRTRAEGQGADQKPNQQADISLGPGDGELHADGVDPGHRSAGQEPTENDHGRGRLHQQDDRVGTRGQKAGGHEEAPHVEPVRETEKGAEQRA